MRRSILLTVISMGVSLGLVRSYAVDPVKASWSGWTSWQAPNNYISQTITCNWDQLDSVTGGYVELFTGDHGAGGEYNLEIKEVLGGQVVAEQADVMPGKGHDWLKFGGITMRTGQSFTKGKQYEFKFTRSGSDSIQYYYSTGNPYEYGVIGIPGMNPHPTQWDLAARVHGIMDTIGADWFGVNPYFPFDVLSLA